ncbi:transcription factor ETV6-like isoform X2 [Macrobrachium rosenbergii]|uniref:transcription factor ETV6-like isoform X2 n=1 Tax=Macrobrachium rosenbergii TaxID=79674 RepID=UPI0034D51158
MESSQLNLSTCHNWLGNIDFDVMRKTYLEEEEEEEEDTNGAFQVENPERAEGDSTFNWWEEDCEVWSQNFDPTGSNLPADADGSQLPEYISTRIPSHVGNGSSDTLDLKPPYLLDDQLESAGPTYTVDSHQIPASDVLVKMKASRKHRVRGPKNWEFLMRLLVDPRTNPALIEWEDEGQGIFRLRNPKTIAQIWASRNGNSGDLSYNNFARGLRHHYKKGILIPIPERQLVYQCGQKALEFLSQIKCSQVPA